MTVRKNSNILKSLLVFVLIFSLLPCAVLAKGKNDRNESRLSDTNPDTGFSVYIEDDADLLNDSEELELLDDMYKITEYSSAAFKTTDNNPYSDTDTFAEEYYRTMFGRDTGVVFVIDMDKRYIFIFSDGRSYGKITKSKARTITDNTFSYAKNANYYGCALETFDQIYKVLDGQRIAQPMKYVGNALLALLCALFINYLVVLSVSKAKKQNNDLMAQSAFKMLNATPPQAVKTHTTKVYNPPSSSSGGGGGGGGGGSSGGGGGHSF